MQTTGNFPVRILIVDDHPNTATTLARAIGQMGSRVEVVSATSGRDALEKTRDSTVDIVITDMIMPEMNGLELVEKLQHHPGGRPSRNILITAYDVPGLKETARRLNVNEIIAKPVRPERICQVVSQILEQWSQPGAPSSTSAKTGGKTFKILVADDFADNVNLLARYLTNEGYEYITASDGMQALEKMRAESPDLVLLDINMPKKDGFAVLEETRADPAIQDIPVIILTAARLDPTDIQEGLILGADDYVTKPFDRRELMARIRTKLRVKQAEDAIRRRNRELSLLPEIGKELSARLDIDELSTVLLKRTVETLGAFLGHLAILTHQGPRQKTHYQADAQIHEEIPFPHRLFEIAGERQQGFIIEDTLADNRWQGMHAGQVRSAVVVPLFGRKDLLGLLILAHEQERYFTLEHMLLLQAIGSQAAIAVENASLFASVSYEQKRLAALLHSAAEAILMFDADNRLALINPAGQRLFTDYQARLGLPLARGSGYDALIGLLENDASPQMAEVTWPDQRVFAARVTPIEDGGHVVILHDVTHFKELERLKNEFIATASHDLKNPIGNILGYGDLLAKVTPVNDTQMGYLNHIRASAQKMNELVQNLLELAQIDMGVEIKRQTLDVGALVSEIAGEFQPQAESKGLGLGLDKTEGLPEIQGDPSKLKQALSNLVGNAIKYTPAGGSIQISAGSDEKAVVIHVKDTGYGIPPEDLPFIFDRFYRAYTQATHGIEGNGLGLAIVKSIVEAHGGQISVESKPDSGSRFTLSLPLMNKNRSKEPVQKLIPDQVFESN